MNVTIRLTAQVSLTADDWCLYDIEGRDEAAAAMNAAAELVIKTSSNADEAIRLFALMLPKWSDFGASDTEPYWAAVTLFNHVFGANI